MVACFCMSRNCNVWQWCPGTDPDATCNGPSCWTGQNADLSKCSSTSALHLGWVSQGTEAPVCASPPPPSGADDDGTTTDDGTDDNGADDHGADDGSGADDDADDDCDPCAANAFPVSLNDTQCSGLTAQPAEAALDVTTCRASCCAEK